MNEIKPFNVDLTLTEVETEFEGWRKIRKKGSRIPQELWDKAISLVGKVSINKIAASLKLNSDSLRKRAEKISACSHDLTTNTKIGFVEMLSPSFSSQSCRVEMLNENGEHMSISFDKVDNTSLSVLCSAFWRNKQ